MTSTDDGRVIWKHIGLHGHSVGTFIADSNAIQWKSAVTGNDSDVGTQRSVPAKALTGALWSAFGRSGHLRLSTQGGSKQSSHNNLKHELRFDGFPVTDQDLLKTVLRDKYNVELKKHPLSAAGASWGNTEVEGRNLVFRQCILEDADEEGEEFEPRDGDEMMSMDLTEVSQCVLPGNNRNEIELQFPESDTVEAGTDQLVSIRFYVPPDPDADPQDRSMPSAAELLQQQIMKKANIKHTTGDVIVQFNENQGTFLTPRGRYSVELYDFFFRMRGAKYDYKIKYDDISRLFLLPKPDEVHMAFVIALDKPIRQGQQRYQYLVLQTTKEQSEITVNLDEETLKKEYNGDLQPVVSGSLSNLVAKTFKVIARKKVFIPGKFANAAQQPCVKCALRANEGHLYPLEKQFVFIHKPPVLIRFDEVDSVEFQRYAGGQGSTRNFDLCITLKSSATLGAGTKEYTFSGIDRSDYAGLYNFLSTKKIRIKNLQGQGLEEEAGRGEPVYNEDEIYGVAAGDGDLEEGSEDEDFDVNEQEEEESVSGSEDDLDDEDLGSEVDEGMDSDLEELRKKAGKSKKAVKKRPKEDDDEDDDDADDSPKKKKKAKKDPNAPKRALSSYMFFSNLNRQRVREENPKATFGQVAKLVAEEFKSLSSEDKQKYEDMAEKDKERYKEEMEKYEPSEEFAKGGTTKGKPTKKKKKDPNAPKKPMSSYMLYSNATRAQIKEENPGIAFGEIAKLIGEKFKKLSEEEREVWNAKAAKAKEEYKVALAKYESEQAAKKPSEDNGRDADDDDDEELEDDSSDEEDDE